MRVLRRIAEEYLEALGVRTLVSALGLPGRSKKVQGLSDVRKLGEGEMRLAGIVATISIASWSWTATAAEEISIERGKLVSIMGGCHDCHTAGYNAAEGNIDPAVALKGSQIGWQGPWGTTYAMNLRLTAAPLTEDGFVSYLKVIRSLPPMPWYNVRVIPESDIRSLYRYIKSLGEPGEQAPTALPAGAAPRTPFIVLAPPQMPAPCSRDLDCGVGEVCSSGEARQCVPQ